MILSTTAFAALALPVTMASANADAPEKSTSKTALMHRTVVSFGAYTSAVGDMRDPVVNATNNSLAVSPDERFAVATNSDSDHLSVIHLRSGRKVAEIKGYVSPRNILFAPDSKTFTVSDSARGVVDRISMRTFDVVKRLPLGAGVFGTAQSKDGKLLYANNAASNTVTVIDQAANRPKSVLTGFSEPRQGIKLAPQGDKLYVTNFDGGRGGKITVLDVTTEKPQELKQIEGFDGVRGLSVNRAGDRLYAASSGNDKIYIVDTASGETRDTVDVGDQPYGAALSPDETVLFSGNKGANSLTAIDPGTGDVKGTVTGLKAPRQAISFSADSQTAWVLNEDLSVAEVDVDALRVVRTLGRR
ncbi:YncE family protein [Streptomyces marokkonensis]|uniref:YncE family protein n=1 Tax=Streptomyces marokkonensis TaxID=324855 RepID=A0ABW6QIQ2_9ACTN